MELKYEQSIYSFEKCETTQAKYDGKAEQMLSVR